MERGFRVPGVPAVPVLGILANLALIYNLPIRGVVSGVVLVGVLVVAYLAWGGAPEVEDLYREVRPAESAGAAATGASGGGEGGGTETRTVPGEATTTGEPSAAAEGERFRVLVAIGRPSRASQYVRLAARLAQGREREPFVQVLNVTEIPDQTPFEMVSDTATGRTDRISEQLEAEDVPVEYSVEGHTSRDVAFDIVQTARNDEAHLILMGYPEEHPAITEAVEYKAPCSVVFAAGYRDIAGDRIETVNVGAGGGPHHLGSLSMVRALAEQGAAVRVISVAPAGGGTGEDPTETVAAFEGLDVDVTEVSANTVADGLVEVAEENGGVLVIGASRNRRLNRWMFGSTPDRVVDRAADADVPVLVYASPGGLPGRVEDYLFPVYRYLRKFTHADRRTTA